ncbi:MAG: replication-associated recombination protein A [Dialister sp.]|nr:replication-associated recombination protein A [Dialister sp.]
MDSLFDSTESSARTYAPLADRMRPTTLSEVAGQDDAVGDHSFLRSMIEKDMVPSILLFGPPGCGKTTIAQVIAHMTESRFIKVNATTSGASDIRKIVDEAKKELSYYHRQTIVFIDEIHRFNKGQQDLLLPYVENGTFTLIGATTENPYFEINGPLRSRMRLIRLHALSKDAIVSILQRALTDKGKGLGVFAYKASPDALKIIADFAGGDSRMALNLLEQACAMIPPEGKLTEKEIVGVAGEHASVYDKNGDAHYDIISAFIKSMRGSDPDAALHYLARLIEGGEKPSFISRRMMICAAEDVGLADPQALVIAVSAAKAAEMVGFPEAQIILAEAVIYICLAPKSNSAVNAIYAARKEVKTKSDWTIPEYLRDAHYSGAKVLGHGVGYKYPHSFGGWVPQRYLPEELEGHTYYQAVENGFERTFYNEWKIRTHH